MSRSTAEWIGRSDDQAVPPRVRARVFLRDGGKCQECGRTIRPGDGWVCDHTVALINGGENREANLRTICGWCDRKVKTPADVREKSKVARVRAKNLGIKPTKGRSKWKRKVDGTVVLR